MLASKASAAIAPTGREDPTAALGVPAVERDEVLTAGADIDRMAEVGPATGAGRSVGPDDRFSTTPTAARRASGRSILVEIHPMSLYRSGSIVDPLSRVRTPLSTKVTGSA